MYIGIGYTVEGWAVKGMRKLYQRETRYQISFFTDSATS